MTESPRSRFTLTTRFTLFILVLGLTAGCGTQPLGLVPTLTPYPTVGEVHAINIVCADFIYPAIQALAATYQRQNPNVIITVVQRADTLAYPLLVEGDIDVAVLTWLPSSQGGELWQRVLVYDGLSIIVHPQNGVPGLSREQVQKLFQGQVENWGEWGGLPGVPQLISRETASGEFLYMQNNVMREIRTSLNATLAPDTGYMLQMVSEDPLAVGYVSSAVLTPDVRAVAIDGVPPSRETIKVEVYPFNRAIFVVTAEEPVEPIRSFIQWMLAYEGQSVLHEYGFVSILD